jgi:hypothetical protein
MGDVMKGEGAMSGHSIELWSGGFLDLSDPQPSDFRREDIVIGLSNVCRFAGQCRRYYSVAEHSVLVADLMRYRDADSYEAFAGLLHDAAEAYIGDMTAPLKAVMRPMIASLPDLARPGTSPYDRLGDLIDSCVEERFMAGWEPNAEIRYQIKVADLWAFRIEAGALLPSHGRCAQYAVPDEIADLHSLPPGVDWYAGLAPLDARDLMRQRWEDLLG